MKFYGIILSLSLVFIFGFVSNSYAQQSTISQYCSNGICNTGSLPSIPTNYTYAKIHLPILFINLSQACENMLKNNITGCTTIGSMIPYDTSNKLVSGQFIKHGNDFIRSSPEVKSNWLYYANSGTKIVCVECTFDVAAGQQAQQIIIQPTSYSFVDTNQNNVTKSWTYFNDRFMQGCDVSTISSIPGLLNDTIHYMLSNCTTTSFNGNVTKTVHDTPWQYDNAFSTLHLQSYLKDIMHNHNSDNTNHTSGGFGPSDCIRHICNFKDPYSKANW